MEQNLVGLDKPDLLLQDLAERFADTKGQFMSNASTCQLLRAHDFAANPAIVVIKVPKEFKNKITAFNQLSQTDFTYFKAISWVRFNLATILDGISWYTLPGSSAEPRWRTM